MRNIPKQPTIPPMPQEKDDEFKITPDEAEKLIKGAKYLTPVIIKSCPHLLPCGRCDKTDLVCSQY